MPSSGVQTCARSEEHTSELQSHDNLVCRLLLEKKKKQELRMWGWGAEEGMSCSVRSAPASSLGRRRRTPAWCPSRRPCASSGCFFFFFNDTATPEIYPLSLPDAFPIWASARTSPTATRCRWPRCQSARSSTTSSSSEEHTSELQSHDNLVCRLLLEKKKMKYEEEEISDDSSEKVTGAAM